MKIAQPQQIRHAVGRRRDKGVVRNGESRDVRTVRQLAVDFHIFRHVARNIHSNASGFLNAIETHEVNIGVPQQEGSLECKVGVFQFAKAIVCAAG